jgi:uncharacterized protein (TIGR00369 family)
MPKKTHAHGHLTHKLPVPQLPILKRNYCFACGQDNPQGMRLKFVYDEAGKRFLCRFRLSRRYWGPPKHAHGGIIATILDEAMGKVNRIRHIIAVTSEMQVRYLKLVPLYQPLVVEARELRKRGREHIYVAEIRNARGEVLATSRGKFVEVDPVRMFAKYLGDATKD